MNALVAMYGAGAVLGAVPLVLPHVPQPLESLRWALAIIAALVAVGLRLLGDHQPPWLSHVLVAAGSVIIGAAVYLAGDDHSAYLYGVFYVWVALYVTFFVTIRAAAAHLALASLTFAVAQVPWSIEDGLRWVLMTGTNVSVLVVGASLERQRERVQSLVDGCVTVVRQDLTIIHQSGAVEAVLGHGAHQLLGRSLTAVLHPDDAPLIIGLLDALSSGSPPRTVECRLRSATGGWVETETTVEDQRGDSLLGGIVLFSRDISERKAFERQLAHQAFHDPLTGLANRALFNDRLGHTLARHDRNWQQLGVLFLDLDDFKAVNDGLGHAAGDDLLSALAARLTATVRPGDTVARFGGDEFAVLLDEVLDDHEALQIANRLLKALVEPVAVAGRDITMSASIGVTLSRPGRDVESVLRDADAAMYRAKSRGKNRVELFEPGMHEPLLRRAALKADLPYALAHEELRLRYQPTVQLTTRRVNGFEALVRWQHPELGLISPTEFIPIAEQTGAIVEIGRWVLEKACSDAAPWLDDLPEMQLNVNVSRRQLEDPGLVDDVRGILERTGFPARLLTLEITESVVLHDLDGAVERLANLRALGVRLAIDDFGTGYSSLSNLQRLPVDILKIDKSFVDQLDGDGQPSGVIDHVVQLAQALKLHTVAEGIEAASQVEALRRLACDDGQGFWFAEPLEARHAAALLRSSSQADLDVA